MFNNLIDFIDRLRKSIILKVFNILLLIISLSYLYNYYLSIDQIKFYKYDFSIVFPILLILFGNFINAFGWSQLLDLGKIKTLHISDWAISSIGKYIPFKVGIPLLRGSLILQNEKITTGNFVKKLLIEQLIIIFYSVIFGCYFFLNRDYSLLALYIFPVIILLLFIILFFKDKITQKTLPYFTYSIGQWFILYGLIQVGNLKYVDIEPKLIFGYFLSATISLLIINIPAGIGIREAFTLFLLNDIYSTNIIYDFVINARILFIFIDLILLAIGLLVRYIYKK